MLDADTLTDSVTVLYECGYNEKIAIRSFQDTGALLLDELIKTVTFFKKMCADVSLTKTVMRRYDYHNLKVFLKERYDMPEPGASVYPFGDLGPDKIKQILKEEAYNGFPAVMGDAVRLLKKIFAAGEPSGRLINITVDVAMYNDTSQFVKKIKNAYIRQYFTCEADLKNICTVAKMKVYGFSKEEMAVQLVRGGNLDTDKLYRLFESAPENAPYIFMTTGYYNLVKELAAVMAGKRPMQDFESRAEEFLFALSKVGKDNYFDSNPLFCWYTEKLTEIETVKLIFECKKNNINADRIREKLRSVYL